MQRRSLHSRGHRPRRRPWRSVQGRSAPTASRCAACAPSGPTGPTRTTAPTASIPVQCNDVLIEDSIVRGASDAGIYVGQSTNVIVRTTTSSRTSPASRSRTRPAPTCTTTWRPTTPAAFWSSTCPACRCTAAARACTRTTSRSRTTRTNFAPRRQHRRRRARRHRHVHPRQRPGRGVRQHLPRQQHLAHQLISYNTAALSRRPRRAHRPQFRRLLRSPSTSSTTPTSAAARCPTPISRIWSP